MTLHHSGHILNHPKKQMPTFPKNHYFIYVTKEQIWPKIFYFECALTLFLTNCVTQKLNDQLVMNRSRVAFLVGLCRPQVNITNSLFYQIATQVYQAPLFKMYSEKENVTCIEVSWFYSIWYLSVFLPSLRFLLPSKCYYNLRILAAWWRF